jgi:hypothetical protein
MLYLTYLCCFGVVTEELQLRQLGDYRVSSSNAHMLRLQDKSDNVYWGIGNVSIFDTEYPIKVVYLNHLNYVYSVSEYDALGKAYHEVYNHNVYLIILTLPLILSLLAIWKFTPKIEHKK